MCDISFALYFIFTNFSRLRLFSESFYLKAYEEIGMGMVAAEVRGDLKSTTTSQTESPKIFTV